MTRKTMFEKTWRAHEAMRETVEVEFDAASVEPMISYGTNPERMDEAIAGRVTDPREFAQ